MLSILLRLKIFNNKMLGNVSWNIWMYRNLQKMAREFSCIWDSTLRSQPLYFPVVFKFHCPWLIHSVLRTPGWFILVDMDTMGNKVILSGAHIMQGCRDSWCCSRKGKKASVWERKGVAGRWVGEIPRGSHAGLWNVPLIAGDCHWSYLWVPFTLHAVEGGPQNQVIHMDVLACAEAVFYRKLSLKIWRILKKWLLCD